jgi:Protein of unknown function (DUF2281)
MDTLGLHRLIDQLPNNLQKQVYDFANFLLEKQAQPIAKRPRVMDLHEGQVWMSKDFDDPLPDEFWLGENK